MNITQLSGPETCFVLAHSLSQELAASGTRPQSVHAGQQGKKAQRLWMRHQQLG
jgi:hypothetical protein